MAKRGEIALSTVLADPRSVFDSVAHECATLSVMGGEEAIAVITPMPVAEPLAEPRRAMLEENPHSSFSLDTMEIRCLLGLWRDRSEDSVQRFSMPRG